MTLSTDGTAWVPEVFRSSFLSFSGQGKKLIFHCPSAVFVLVLSFIFAMCACFDLAVYCMPIVYLLVYSSSLYQYIPAIEARRGQFRVTLSSSSSTCLTIRKSQCTQFLPGRPWEDGRPLLCSALVYSHSMRNIRRKRYSSQKNRTYS